MTVKSDCRKRMVVSKYSNRPPFELKTNESSVISKNSEKFKKSLESINKSYNSIIKQLDNIEIDKKHPPNKNIIPKIIESFQKITPKREVIIVRNRNCISSQNSASLQTLYRNKKSNFGKHIPKHKIMTNLLKNFGSGTKMYIESDQVDTVPTRDTECPRKRRDGYAKIKVDKTTSTSGIIWPVLQYHPLHVRSSEKKIRNNQSHIPHFCSNKPPDKKSKIPKRKNSIRAVEMKDDKEKVSTTCDTDSNPSNPENKPQTHARNREHTYIVDEEYTGAKKESSVMKKEKSFVQRQVDKFNKLETKKQGRNKTSRTLDLQKRNWHLSNNYLGMMASAKKGFPKIEDRFQEHAATDNYDWSDSGYTDKPEVKFPKETRHAMESIIRNGEESGKTPLSRYWNHRNLDIQPAIPNQQHRRESAGISEDVGLSMCFGAFFAMACQFARSDTTGDG